LRLPCFPADAGINYRAILDTALDVAKAMLHLHSLNVLHADLKARNIMLKSGGEGRTIMAKVADFGLSVKMDVMETHISSVFQVGVCLLRPPCLTAWVLR
jgi:serine/threonine protein kinase